MCCLYSVGIGSRNLIVGLTNSDSALHAPVLWNYTLCGQYHKTLPSGATVTVQCGNAYQRGLLFRYVIVQSALINEQMSFCEIEVFTVGKLSPAICQYAITINSYSSLCHSYSMIMPDPEWSTSDSNEFADIQLQYTYSKLCWHAAIKLY